jgi:hypothetical protein
MIEANLSTFPDDILHKVLYENAARVYSIGKANGSRTL